MALNNGCNRRSYVDKSKKWGDKVIMTNNAYCLTLRVNNANSAQCCLWFWYQFILVTKKIEGYWWQKDMWGNKVDTANRQQELNISRYFRRLHPLAVIQLDFNWKSIVGLLQKNQLVITLFAFVLINSSVCATVDPPKEPRKQQGSQETPIAGLL